MKTILLSTTLLLLLSVGCSRNKTEVQVPQAVVYEDVDVSSESQLAQLESSLANWNNIKDKRGNSYQYTRKSLSSWGGIKSETIIKVQDDFVFSRIYYIIDDENIISSSWREEGFDALNDHTEGAPTKRMDELYDECRAIIVNKNDVSLSFDGSGVLANCNYGKQGITIENFVFLWR